MSSSPNHHSLHNLKGEDLPGYLARQVDGDNWKRGVQHQFHTGDKTNPPMKITANPTTNQPGNGVVMFREDDGSYTAPRHKDLQSTYQDPSFRQKREAHKQADLSKADFKQKSVRANVLLDYEEGRRNETSGNHLTRSEVRKGTNKTMDASTSSYPEKVSFNQAFVCYVNY